jgi:protein arginine N-methyltransferase 3
MVIFQPKFNYAYLILFYFLWTVDLSKVQPSTELENRLLQLLQETLERSTNLEGQFEEYKSMVKSSFFDNLVDTNG